MRAASPSRRFATWASSRIGPCSHATGRQPAAEAAREQWRPQGLEAGAQHKVRSHPGSLFQPPAAAWSRCAVPGAEQLLPSRRRRGVAFKPPPVIDHYNMPGNLPGGEVCQEVCWPLEAAGGCCTAGAACMHVPLPEPACHVHPVKAARCTPPTAAPHQLGHLSAELIGTTVPAVPAPRPAPIPACSAAA